MSFTNSIARYPEKHLQLAALAWAEVHLGYRPIADDVEATGDRMDAIGNIGEELIVIETKVTVSANTVPFSPARSGTIEPKIAATLDALYSGETRGQVGMIARYWNGKKPITFGVLAGHYPGLSTLQDLLKRRSVEWKFNYRIWQWTGERIDELAQSFLHDGVERAQLAAISFPVMVARPIRKLPLTFADLEDLAEKRGVSEVFRAIVRDARAHQMKLVLRPSGVALRLPGVAGSQWCAIFVESADAANGINCGIYAEVFVRAGLSLPGVAAPDAGFLNTNRYIRTGNDVAALFAPFRDRRPCTSLPEALSPGLSLTSYRGGHSLRTAGDTGERLVREGRDTCETR